MTRLLKSGHVSYHSSNLGAVPTVVGASVHLPALKLLQTYQHIYWKVVFLVITLCSSEAAQHFRGTQHLHLLSQSVSRTRNHKNQQQDCLLLFCVAYSLTLMMGVGRKCSSEPSGSLWTTHHYNPENYTFHSHCQENIKHIHIFPAINSEMNYK